MDYKHSYSILRNNNSKLFFRNFFQSSQNTQEMNGEICFAFG